MAGGDRPDAARHGLATPRDLAAFEGVREGRFGRMFASLPVRAPSPAAIDELAADLKRLAGGRQNRAIPAGYTYLAQFVDHDITFDTTSQLGRPNDPDELPNARTPRLDLDSLYGSGPVDQPYLYDWSGAAHGGAKLLLDAHPGDERLATFDLPRNSAGRALIGDPRNDENLIVCQLHALFARFHNAVVERLAAASPQPRGAALLEAARRAVRHRYQAVVLHDLLPKLLGAPAPARRFYEWRGRPFIPVEFSAAAYRCGHSMVRPDYIVRDSPGGAGDPPSIPILALGDDAGELDHLGGFRPVPRALQIQWKHFFASDPGTAPQVAQLVDEHLVAPLYRLPARFARDLPDDEGDATTTSLARLNLLRGHALGLPAGQDVARALAIEPLAPERLFANVATVSPSALQELSGATPLWFYVLREAEQLGERGKHLGPVGGAIVGEVLTALVENDPESFLHAEPVEVAGLARAGTQFTMVDVVRFVEDNT
jgi:hypothetical protein